MIKGLYKCFDHWSEQGTVWIYSDTHFGDQDLEFAFSGRPSADEHVKLINSKVGKKDTLILLGDVGDVSRVKELRGYKVLIMGNHDCGRSLYERKIEVRTFDKDCYDRYEAYDIMAKAYPGYRISIEEGYDFHYPFEFYRVFADNGLFDEVYEGPLMIGEKLLLSHEPIDVPWAFNIHGHDHNKHHEEKNSLNVCADVVGYLPVNLNQFMKSGALKEVVSLHRATIDKASKRGV